MAENNQFSLVTLKQQVESVIPKMADAVPITALAQHVVSPERIARYTVQTVAKNPLLQRCSTASILSSMMEAANLGLDFGPLGHAYLVPRWSKKAGGYECTMIIGYRGLISVAKRSGEIAYVLANVVYSQDEFSIDLAGGEKPRHYPAMADRGTPVGVYAVAKLNDGSYLSDWMTWDEVGKIKARSTSKTKEGDAIGPWVTDECEMARKTVVRRLVKYLPMSIELADAVEKSDAEFPSLASTETTKVLATRSAKEKLAAKLLPKKSSEEAIELKLEHNHQPPTKEDCEGRAMDIGMPSNDFSKLWAECGSDPVKAMEALDDIGGKDA